jgi:hypothetical protein
MYNILYDCSYFKDIVTNTYNLEGKNEIQNMIYREDILNIFGLEKFDEESINREIEIIYGDLQDVTEIRIICAKLASSFLSEDKLLGFSMLFSFDYLYLVHPFICIFKKTKVLDKQLLTQLMEKVDLDYSKKS